MDFCSWCEGTKRSAQLTRQGKSGGICKTHQEQFTMTPEKLAELKEAFRKAREKQQ